MKKTIEMKKAASVNEAIEIINRLNYRNDTFEYRGYTREDNADIKYRHFDGYKENGEPDGFSLIEIVVGGKLEVVRFFNHFRNITVDIKLGDFNPDYSRYDEVIDADAQIENNAKVKAEVKTTIEAKIAKNGVKLYYVDGKRVGKAAAMEIAANLDRQIMSGLFEQTNTDNVKACVTAQFNTTLGEALIDNFYFDSEGAAIDAANKILATFAGRIISIRVSDNGSWNNCKIFAASNNGNPLTFYNYSDEIQADDNITKFEEGKTYYRIWNEDTGRPHMSHFTITKRTAKTVVLKNGYRCRIFVNDNGVEVFKAGYGTYVYADNLCTVEAEKRQANSDAAWDKMEADAQRRMLELKAAEAERYEIMSTPLTTQDALEVAVRAEIQNANNVKINDLKWEIRYTEGSINDLDKNHIAHFPNDQSLQERRAELVNELAALNSQLADLLPNEIQVTDNEAPKFKYYLQSRRPIAGAVPNGYISATQGEMKVHSLRSDGSISPVPRKVVFGVVVYDHPLSDQQIINYDLHVDPLNPKVEPLNPKVEPDTTELSDEEVAEIKRRSQINAIKSRIATFERAIERQYDAELENSLIAAKAQLAEIEPANTHEANHITGLKEEQPMTNREKLLALRKEYIITDRLSANNSSMWYVNGKRSSQVKVWNLLQSYGLTLAEFLAEDEAYINECIAASCKKIAIKKQADFLYDKIKRDAQPSGDNVFDLLPDLDQLNDLSETDPYFMDDDAEYTERDARFNYGERYAAALTEKLSQYDPTVEVTYDIDYDDEDVYYLKFDGIYRSRYTLSGIESAFYSLKKDIAEEEFMKRVDGTLDDKIAALKRKQARNSINRAIKQCIRNRIGYLKSHNSKMEKYEYELLHLLQGARRELEVA